MGRFVCTCRTRRRITPTRDETTLLSAWRAKQPARNTQGSRKDKKAAYKEMIEVMDQGVGKVISTLRRLGLERNTFVFFCSDNGATKLGSNGALRGFKGQLWEGGHRVPAIAYWPGKIAPGVSKETVLGMDLFPTLAALAGAKSDTLRSLDGTSLVPLLLNGRKLPERRLFWESKGNVAMRDGEWKFLLHKSKDGKTKASLFNLATSPGESDDRGDEEKERAERMQMEAETWLVEVTDGVEKRT